MRLTFSRFSRILLVLSFPSAWCIGAYGSRSVGCAENRGSLQDLPGATVGDHRQAGPPILTAPHMGEVRGPTLIRPRGNGWPAPGTWPEALWPLAHLPTFELQDVLDPLAVLP